MVPIIKRLLFKNISEYGYEIQTLSTYLYSVSLLQHHNTKS